jgi:hypothetical protein
MLGLCIAGAGVVSLIGWRVGGRASRKKPLLRVRLDLLKAIDMMKFLLWSPRLACAALLVGLVAVGTSGVRAAEGTIAAELGSFRDESGVSGAGPTLATDDSGRPVLRFAGIAKSFAVYDGVGATGKTSVDFRTTGKVSFALLLRGLEMNAPAYIVFLETGASDKGMARLYIAKTDFAFKVNPRAAKLASKSFAYTDGEWCRLSVSFSPGGEGKLDIDVAIQEEGSGRVLAQVAAVDEENPILEEGLVAIRFFSETGSEGNQLEVRSVEFSAAGN